MFAFSTLHKNWLPSFILSPSRRDLEFLHFALIFSPGPGEKGAAVAPKRGSFVSAPSEALSTVPPRTNNSSLQRLEKTLTWVIGRSGLSPGKS